MQNDNKHVPEFVLKDGDTAGIKIKTVKFYPQDIEKMEKMSLEERIAFKGKLKELGRYTYEED